MFSISGKEDILDKDGRVSHGFLNRLLRIIKADSETEYTEFYCLTQSEKGKEYLQQLFAKPDFLRTITSSVYINRLITVLFKKSPDNCAFDYILKDDNLIDNVLYKLVLNANFKEHFSQHLALGRNWRARLQDKDIFKQFINFYKENDFLTLSECPPASKSKRFVHIEERSSFFYSSQPPLEQAEPAKLSQP